VLQSLYLAYRDLEQPDSANHWRQIAVDYGSQRLDKSPWKWTELTLETVFTYIPFDRNLSIAVVASLQSATTRCLLAEGDWFERELELWRQYIQPGMTVIDVGAGVGVYTFSAAQRVGVNGIVYAIEPFSESIDCLKQTCLINKIENVKIIDRAVSDRYGKCKLVLQSSSELNYLAAVNEPLAPETEVEEVTCITLDSFVEQMEIDRVEVIKISTEGNELAILIGCEQILAKFAPTIIYNSYTSNGINLEAARYLLDRGYELFRYQPYLQQLIPLVNEGDFNEVMKAIAIPK
jgi:FkbM family methyltransferase